MLASRCRQEFQALLSQVPVRNKSIFTCLSWMVLGRAVLQTGGCLFLWQLNTLNLLNITGVLRFVEGIHALSSVSLYLVRYMLLYDVSVSQIRLILFLTDFTI